jgi:hypothetical protein
MQFMCIDYKTSFSDSIIRTGGIIKAKQAIFYMMMAYNHINKFYTSFLFHVDCQHEDLKTMATARTFFQVVV